VPGKVKGTSLESNELERGKNLFQNRWLDVAQIPAVRPILEELVFGIQFLVALLDSSVRSTACA
jgi:hypothetical protein